EMFGWSEGEVVGQLNPIFKDDPEYHELCRKVWQGAIYPRVELCRFKKSGTPIDIVFSAAPLQDSEGRINGLVAVMADITEHKQQEEQVRLLQSVVLNTNDAVVITEAEPIEGQGPRILYVNEAFTRISGYRPEEVLGKTPRILQGPNTDRRALDKVRTALACWQPATVEVINYRKDGTEFWNEFSIVPVADKAGWYTHWIAVQRDTTERKAVEQALRQSEERFRSLIENALDIITILDPDGIIHYESPSVEKVLGYRVAELIGTGFFDNIHPDDCAKTALSLNRTLQEAAAPLSSPIEFRCKHQDGSWRVLEAIAQTFVDNAAPRIIVNSRDITERKRLDEIRLALEQEKELGELKTRFFSMASHEFRTPLSTALAAAQLLENSQDAWDDTAKRMRNLHRIQDALKQIAQLLDDILMINRAETGKLEFNPKPIALEPFCRHFVEEMRLSAGPNHALHFTCHGQPAVLPHLDERLLRSILANLLSNAIKYSPKGGVVHLSLEFQLQRILLKVEDQGIGIQVTDQAQLFAPFQRGKNVASIPGTGLGLVVVKKCVDLHQGSVTISSTVDRGTTCIVSLPVLVP
ncbi:MAG TPA: PAS domain S-box protein, partial [Stenomitos sp.]